MNKEKGKGYLDAEDGDVSTRDTGNAVLEPQAVSLLRSNVSDISSYFCWKAPYPCDVVVSIHDAAHGVYDEDHHKDQPVGKVGQCVSHHVGGNKGAERDKCGWLFES